MSAAVVRAALASSLEVLVAEESELGRIDAVAGDGDHGAGMVRGFRAAVASAAEAGSGAGDVLVVAGSALGDAAGGASGALWGMLLGAVGTSLQGHEPPEAGDVARALRSGLEAVEKVGRSAPGDKTMIDALDPFVASLEKHARTEKTATAWMHSLPAAVAGRDATRDMVTRRGRAAALGEKSKGHVDPGAYSLCLILEAVSTTLGSEAHET